MSQTGKNDAQEAHKGPTEEQLAHAVKEAEKAAKDAQEAAAKAQEASASAGQAAMVAEAAAGKAEESANLANEAADDAMASVGRPMVDDDGELAGQAVNGAKPPPAPRLADQLQALDDQLQAEGVTLAQVLTVAAQNAFGVLRGDTRKPAEPPPPQMPSGARNAV